MSANSLFQEVFERNLLSNSKEKPQRSMLEGLLKSHLKGNIRPPTLSFGDVMEPLNMLNLGDYEVSLIEPLHDIKGHVKNIWDLLPKYLSKENEILFNEEKEIALGSTKDTYRGRDYRLSVILIYTRLLGKLPKEIEELLYTLKEICRLAYMESYKRSPKFILRLFNMCYIHLVRCVEVFGKSPKISKVYGSYFHAITVHLPEHSKIIAPSSLHTESEERIFNALLGIGKDTSQRTQQSVRDTGIIR